VGDREGATGAKADAKKTKAEEERRRDDSRLRVFIRVTGHVVAALAARGSGERGVASRPKGRVWSGT